MLNNAANIKKILHIKKKIKGNSKGLGNAKSLLDTSLRLLISLFILQYQKSFSTR
jgi:hypothetical protein